MQIPGFGFGFSGGCGWGFLGFCFGLIWLVGLVWFFFTLIKMDKYFIFYCTLGSPKSSLLFISYTARGQF